MSNRDLPWRGARPALAAAILLLGGCGESSPFPLEPVQGVVKYTDGSAIHADKLRIVFHPQGVAAVNNVAPRAASTYTTAPDGAFGDLTTWKYADGAIVGRHKVTVMSLGTSPQGQEEPTPAVPASYHREETTPLEVEVVGGGDNDFIFEIAQGSAEPATKRKP